MAIIDCKKKSLMDAAVFYAEKLGIPEDTLIIIKTKKKLKNQLGWIEKIPSDDIQAFLIMIEDRGKKSLEDPLSVLAHEMVHVKQYACGDLVDGPEHSMWKNNRVEDPEPGSEEYYFSPWEIEAYGMQVGLLQMYMRKKERVLH